MIIENTDTRREKILESLNPSQNQATKCLEGPLLVLAGAGSGKTRVLTHRAALLVAEGLSAPEDILAVTFTNKAAREMEHRVTKLLFEIDIPVMAPLWFSTFHSTCVRILRQHIELLEYKRHFGIFDSSDQLSMVKKVMAALNVGEKAYSPKVLQGKINSAKSQAQSPIEIEKSNGYLMDDISLKVYRRYEEDMKASNSLDFSDLLLKTYELFRHYPDILEQYQDRFRYIMVDEYQDTNRIQYLLTKLLASKYRNLCVVGDEDQSIYSWRGADISNILNFEEDFPEAQVVKLEQNYRSTKNIVDASNKLIQYNSERKEKVLFTENEPGDKITVREERNEYDEARFVVKKIQAMCNTGEYGWQDVAVFYRTNAQSRVIEEQLRSNSIAYKIIGGIRFYERMEIKDVLAYMKLILNPSDDISAKRIINVPARGIGKTSIGKIEDYANEQRVSFLEAARYMIENKMVHSGLVKKISTFLNMIDQLTNNTDMNAVSDVYHAVLDATGYVQKLNEDGSPEALARVENLEEFDNAISQFESEREDHSLQDFLEEMALVSDVDGLEDDANSVTLMTLHIAKGLEFPIVCIVGMEEGLFPTPRAADSNDATAIEEERRLAYVGMTRARQKLFMSYARSRRVWGSEQFNPPSRFLKEIPDDFLDMQTSISRPRIMSSASPSTSMESYDSDPFPDYENDNPFPKGARVKHPTFGVGSIMNTEGNGDQQKVSVVFADRSVRKFVVKYARLERLY